MKTLLLIFILILVTTAYTFKTIERFEFDMYWGFIYVGQSTIELKVNEDSPTILIIQSTARSASFFDKFHKVRDNIFGICNREDYHTYFFYKHLHEGSYIRSDTVIFDYSGKKLSITKNKNGKLSNKVLDINRSVWGPWSAFYWMRKQNFNSEKNIYYITTYNDKGLYQMPVIIHEKDDVDVEAGEFDCTIIEPIMQSEGIFKKEGKLRIWVAHKKGNIPVMMKSKVTFGSITAELKKYIIVK